MMNKGFSLVLVQHKEKDFLVAFGGSRKEPSNQVEVVGMDKNETSMSRQFFASKAPGPMLFGKTSSSMGLAAQLSTGSSQCSVQSHAGKNLASAVEQHGSGRKSLSEALVDPNSVPGTVSLHKQFVEEEHSAALKMAKNSNGTSSSLAMEHRINQPDMSIQNNLSIGKIIAEETSCVFEYEKMDSQNQGIGKHLVDNEDVLVLQTDGMTGGCHSSMYELYETKITALIRKNGVLEGQLAAALSSRDAADKNLSSVLKSRQEMEKKLADTLREMEMLKEKLAGVELAQEEANSLTNIVHSDNVRLEHDVAFLKAVLDDTQKELHSTRGVLSGERARAFQRQIEVFHLKQRLQSMENRVPTPRKQFNV